MNNIPICLVGAIFIGTSVYTMMTCKTCKPFIDYQDSLDDELKELYYKSVEERQKLYLQG